MAPTVIERMRYSHLWLKKEIDHDQDIKPHYEKIMIPGTLTSKAIMCLNVDISRFSKPIQSESLIEVVLQCRYIRTTFSDVTIYIANLCSPDRRESTADVEPV